MQTSIQNPDEWLMRILVSQKLLDETAQKTLRRQNSIFISTELLQQKLLTKEQLAQAVQEHYRIPFAEPSVDSLDQMALSLVPEQLCRKYQLLPIKLDGENIELLMANPIDSTAQDAVRDLTGRKPIVFFGLPNKIEELIAAAYNSDAMILDLLKKLPEETPVEWLGADNSEDSAQTGSTSIGAPLIRLANSIISQAIRMKASDIHIEHEEKTTVVRYRIDGVLRNMIKVPKHMGEGPLVSRIKIMANLDIANRRRPQDGRAKLKVGYEEIGLRVSTIPTAFGEKVVLRIIDQRQAEVPLEKLGFRPEILDRIIRLSESNQGLLLMTGPTGSGKTTTLYSILNRIKSADINIVTVEDPIEYRLAGVNQVQVNDKAGLGFATILRSVLRQDPDVVLVGEVRDQETADIAFQAALTGHMVFSTLHTNNAIATIDRLINMNVERFKMAPALMGVVSQRLVRRVCPHCRVEESPNSFITEILRESNFPIRQFKGKGCEPCSFTGFKGRIAVTELLDLSSQTARDLINSGADTTVLRAEALKNGWLLTMAQDALWHLANGDVVFEEVATFMEPPTADSPKERPRGRESDGISKHRVSTQTPTAPSPSSARKVLIVDDNMDNRGIARALLHLEGYQLSEAENGLQAIEEISRDKPDLVLLDIMMPGMDGFAVLKRLREEMGLSDLPIMILTAMGEAESQALALELGADDYLSKPFNPKVLKARVKALFRRHEYAPNNENKSATGATL